jgi:hypothetical protein
MNPVNNAQLKEFASAFDLSGKSESDQFELYTVYSILNGGSGENVDPFAAHLKGNEFGIDVVAIIIQGNLVTNGDEAASLLDEISNPQIDFYFFQSKTSSDFDYGAVSKFLDGVRGFFVGDMHAESAQLDDLIDAKDYVYQHGVKKQNPGLHCFFATTGAYEGGGRLGRLVENTINEFRELSIFDEERLRVEMIGASALQRLYRAAITASEVTIDFDKNIALPPNDAVEEGYIGYLPGIELLKIVSVVDADGDTPTTLSHLQRTRQNWSPSSTTSRKRWKSRSWRLGWLTLARN